MVINSPLMPKTETVKAKPDDTRQSGNDGINMALGLTLILSIVIIMWALLVIPYNSFGTSFAPTVSTKAIAPGTLGAVINKTGSESSSDLSHSQSEKVQSDTISPVGPGGFAKSEPQYDPNSRLFLP